MLNLEALNQRFEGASPGEVLSWASEIFGEKLAIVTSFQPTGIVALHMLREIAPRLPVLTVDTGLLFSNTYLLMDHIAAEWDLNLIRVRPGQTPAQQAEIYGEALWLHDPDLCCQLRKVTPLKDALTAYDAWITGLRRDQAETRRLTKIVSWDSRYENVKISPFAAWTEEMVWAYLLAHKLPYNPLHDQNYTSIGCQPCTRAIAPNEESRAGRWTGTTKVECGIHSPNTGVTLHSG